MKLDTCLLVMNGLAAMSLSQGAMTRGQLDAGNFPAKSDALKAMLQECGDHIGDGSVLDLQVGDGSGSCPDNGVCDNFYTVGNLLKAIDAYNDGKSLDEQFPSPVRGSRCLTFAAFLGQTYFESAKYQACKEYVSPCGDPSKCSGGKASDYNPANQGDWKPNAIPGSGAKGPSSGCTDYWGNKESDSANCWFGRGAIQITWLANYAKYNLEYINNPDQICQVGKAGWAGSVAYWQANKAKFTGSCQSATSVPNPASCDKSCHKARCDAQEKFEENLKPKTSPPTPPPPSKGSYKVPASVAAGGCWKIIDTICPGKGNSWSENLCTPAHAPGVCPPIYGGDTIEYNCNGCGN